MRALWCHRWWMVAAAWVVCAAGWLFVAAMPNHYQASARVEITGAEAEGMFQALLSRSSLERAVRMADSGEGERALDPLARAITVKRAEDDTLFTITYAGSDPVFAKNLLQSLLTILAEGSTIENQADSGTAAPPPGEKITEAEGRMAAAEERLREFRRLNADRPRGGGRSHSGEFEKVMAELAQAETDSQEAESRRDDLKRQLAEKEERARAAPASPAPGDPLLQRLEAKRKELLLKYTPQHPDVVTLQKTIDELRRKAEAQQAVSADAGTAPVPPADPALARMKHDAGEAETMAASLKTRVDELRRRAGQLQQTVETVPEADTELAQLTNNYNAAKSEYESLLAQRDARGGEPVNEQAVAASVRVVEPPYVLPGHSGPSRPLLSSAVLLGGLMAGLAAAFVMGWINPRYDNRRALRDITCLPVLGGVSMVWTPARKRRHHRDVLVFSASVAGLLAVYGGMMALGMLDIDVAARFRTLT